MPPRLCSVCVGAEAACAGAKGRQRLVSDVGEVEVEAVLLQPLLLLGHEAACHLCRKQARYGRPARPPGGLLAADWPKLAEAWGMLGRSKKPPERQLAEG